MCNYFDYIEKARAILTEAGILFEPLDCSGEMAYRGTTHKPHSTTGRYKFHLDQFPVLWFCNRHNGDDEHGHTVKLYSKEKWQAMTEAEREAVREHFRQEQEEARKRNEKARQEAAREAEKRFSALPLAGEDNAYLKRKGVLPRGDMRQDVDGRLVLPLLNAEGETVSLQLIAGDGEKRYLPGGEKAGCSFPVPAKDGGKSGPLLIGEGVATVLSCCMATGYAGLVAFDAGNLPPVAQMTRQTYPGREIIICGDNDCTDKDGKPRSEEANTGVLCARKAAEAIGAKLAICPAIRGHKADFNDLFTDTEDGPERVRVCIEKAIQEEAASDWEEPVRFAAVNTPKLDVAQLPPVLAEFCAGVAEEKQVPVELPVAMAIAALATAAQGRFVLEVRTGYTEPLNVYTLCPLEPANRKSAVVEACSAPLKEWERETAQAMAAEVKAVTSKRKTLEKAIEGHRRKAERCASMEELEALQKEILELEKQLPDVPQIPRLLADNTTPEALAQLMEQLGGSVAIITAEGGIFDILAGMYSKGVPNLDLFLKAHSGDMFRVDRRSGEPIYLDHPCLTMGITPQPVTLAERSAAKLFRARGLDGRFLYFLPESLLGYRKLEPEQMAPHIRERFRLKVRSLLSMGSGEVSRLSLSPEAYQVWLEFAGAVEKELCPGGEFDGMNDWGGKLAGAVARLAGLFHLAEHDQPQYQTVTEETMARAVYMGSLLTEHAKAAYHLMGSDEKIENAKAVLAWIRRRGLERFKANDCWQGVKGGRFTEAAVVKQALKELEERGFIRELPCALGRKPSPAYAVNPATLKG